MMLTLSVNFCSKCPIFGGIDLNKHMAYRY